MNSKPRGGRSQLALRAHLHALHQTLQEGADIHGYFALSVFDNFEWERGYGPRFGLVRINPETLERIPNQGEYWFRDIIEQNSATL